jgi:hypothetical protein
MSTLPPDFPDLDSCKRHAERLVSENNIEPKKTKLQFIWSEFVALSAQVLVFACAFGLMSNFLEEKGKAVQIFIAKVGPESMKELTMLGLGILIVVGILAVISKGLPSAQTYIDDFVLEIPRAIYAFGASSTAASFCLALYMRWNPEEVFGTSIHEVVGIGLSGLFLSFAYGCALSFVFKRNQLK